MILAERERTGKAEARQALERFDRKNWRRWAQRLPQRAREMPFDGLIFQQVALDRWKKARELDRRARRSPSRVAWHRLRIGIKRFRYMVENFLPSRHAEWGEDLKHMQDLLGDVHDLDVLRSELLALGKLLDENERTQWEEWIERERKLRLTEYRSRTRGEDSLWTRWRRGLLGGEAPAARPESEEPSGEEAKQVVPSAG